MRQQALQDPLFFLEESILISIALNAACGELNVQFVLQADTLNGGNQCPEQLGSPRYSGQS